MEKFNESKYTHMIFELWKIQISSKTKLNTKKLSTHWYTYVDIKSAQRQIDFD